jgi:hypothetical protein
MRCSISARSCTLTFDFSEVDIRIPRLAQRPRHRARHAGKLANVIQLGKTAFIKRRLDTGLHLLCRNGVGETAGKSRGHLRQGQNLLTVFITLFMAVSITETVPSPVFAT